MNLPVQHRAPTLNRLAGIQWGRAIAAMLVVVCHSIAAFYEHAPGLTHLLARTGVTLFFVISGFIMVATTTRDNGRFDPVLFMRKRLTRIVPLYYAATLLVAALALFVPSVFKSTPFDLGHIGMSMLFLPTYTPDTHMIEPFYKLGWTLNYEMFFYVVFASLFWMTTLARTVTIVGLLIVLSILGLLFNFENAALAFYSRLDVLAFAAGTVIATISVDRRLRVGFSAQIALLLGSFVLLLLLAANYDAIREAPATQIGVLFVCSGVAVVLAGYQDNGSSLATRVLLLLGDASYAIYLFHMFAVSGTWWVVRHLFPTMSLVGVTMTVIAASIISAAVGITVYYYFEKPVARAMKVRPAPRLVDGAT